MKLQNKSECDFIHFVRDIFSNKNTINYPKEVPALTKDIVSLIEDTFRKGIPQFLIESGAWKKERSLQENKQVEGRLWHRYADLSLDFSNFIFDVLTKKASSPTTFGDYLVQYLLGRKTNFVHENPLLLLIKPENKKADFKLFVENSWILESLQEDFAKFWLAIENEKRVIVDWKKVRKIGLQQEYVIHQYLREIEKHKKYDLARFLFMVMEKLPARGFSYGDAPKLSDRQEVWRAITVIERTLPRMQRWYTASGYFDDDYGNTQLFKGYWDYYHANEMLEKFQNNMVDLDPLKPKE